MPTEYGPVNLRFRNSADGKTLEISFSANWRQKPSKIVFHPPPLEGLKAIIINGKRYSARGEAKL